MNNSKKNYKKKIIRKYVEFYPTDEDMLQFIDFLKIYCNIPFQKIVKNILRQMMNEARNNDGKRDL